MHKKLKLTNKQLPNKNDQNKNKKILKSKYNEEFSYSNFLPQK